MFPRSSRSRSPLKRLMFPEMTCRALFRPPPRPGKVLMPFTTADGFYDTIGASLPAESVMFLNYGADWSARNSESGFVSADLVEKFGGVNGPAVQPLLSLGIAERAKKGRVRIVPGKGITILNANESARPARAETAPSARRTALYRAPGLKKALRARDRDRCRYCAVPVRWGAGRAPDSAVWDWLDPGGPLSAENIVTACKACCEVRDGRPLKDSGLTLIDPPEDCDASCDASEQGERPGDPSRRHCDASGGPSAGQKRHSDAGPIDRSKSDLDLSPRSKSKSKSARTRGPQPGSPDFRAQVITTFAEVAKVEVSEIGPEVADAIAAEVLGAREGVGSPLLYVLQAIRSEGNPLGRWLPGYARPSQAAPSGLEWCGDCDEIYRTLENEKGQVYDCPACSPKSFAAWEATA